jgi:hypothetical protein
MGFVPFTVREIVTGYILFVQVLCPSKIPDCAHNIMVDGKNLSLHCLTNAVQPVSPKCPTIDWIV